MTAPTPKTSNASGVCPPSEHCMNPVLPRLPDVEKMIEGKYYFAINAPRQDKNTTFLNALTDEISAKGKYMLYTVLYRFI
ncbi:MAG: hypothetical protein LBU12_05780 [Deltaproteobacteria bacterium]|nr:hypothetical protein [Deltaproteobacteria bacterium]